MKRKIIIGCAAGAAAIAFASVPVAQLKMRQAIGIVKPVMNDSVDTKGKKYDVSSMLDEKISTDLRNAPTEIIGMRADSTYSIARPSSGDYLYLLQAEIMADRYTKGKLRAGSDAMFSVLAGDEEIIRKNTSEDSLSSASFKEKELVLEPGDVSTITVKAIVSAKENASPASLRLEFIPDKDYADSDVKAASAIKHRFLLENTVDGDRVRSTSISPDGKYVIISHSVMSGKDKFRRYSTLNDLRTGKMISGALPERSSWTPGSQLVYTEKEPDGTYSLYQYSLPTLVPELKYRGLPTDNFDWSPDMKYLIYTDVDEGVKESGPLRRYISQDDRIPGNRSRASLKKYDLATGLSQTLTFGNHSTSLLDIAPDSRHILYMTTRETPSRYPFQYGYLLQLDVNTMKVDTIVADNAFLNNAMYSPDGKKIAVMGSPRCFGNIGVNAGNQPTVNDFDYQLYILDPADGSVKCMTRDFNPSVFGAPRWNRADGQIYFLGCDGFLRKLYKLNPANGKITNLPLDCDLAGNFSIGDSESTWLSYTGEGYTYAGKAYLLNLKTGKSSVLADPLARELASLDFGKSEDWKFTASDGTVIDGTFTLPPDFDPSKKYPLLVYYYGGTSPSQKSMSHPYVPQLYASRGYVVYVVNPSGTYGYGQEFSARHVNAWGKRTADDIIEGVKEFCRQHPYVNDKKIGCFGASYGGFMTQYLQTQTDIFAAAVSHAGISNVTSYWGEGYWGYTYNTIAAAESYPWTDPELFTRQGSLFNADKIHTPLLLLHGTADTNVPIGESIQLFNALKILGRDVEFISVADEDHVSGGYPWEKRQLWQNTIMAWFDKYLKDQPQWWNEMYPERVN